MEQLYPDDSNIPTILHRLSSLSRHDPERPFWLFHLANARAHRYNLSHQMDDLDKHLLHSSEAILLPFRPWSRCHINIVQEFFGLARALVQRSNHSGSGSKKIEYLEHSIQYMRHLRDSDLPLESWGLARRNVTETLVQVLSMRATLGDGDGTQIAEEMVRLCHELLASAQCADYPVNAFINLGSIIDMDVPRAPQGRALDQVIECLREAVKLSPPELHEIHLELGSALQFRFWKTPSDDDYNEAMTTLEKSVAYIHLQDNLCPCTTIAPAIMAGFTVLRCSTYKQPEYVEEAISRCRSWLAYASLGDEGHSTFIELLKWCMSSRAKQFGLTETPQAVLPRDLVLVLSMSTRILRNTSIPATRMVFSKLNISAAELEEDIRDVPKSLGKISEKSSRLSLLALGSNKAPNRANILVIEEAIKYQRMALQVASNDPSLAGPRIGRFDFRSLGSLLRTAFDLNGKVEYLEESISMYRRALGVSWHNDILALMEISTSSLDCWRLLGRKQDLDESMRLYNTVADDQYAPTPERLDRAHLWMSRARETGHPSALIAYQSVISLVQALVVFTPTLGMQYARLFSKDISEVPMECASYLIHTDRLEQAFEALEQGRTLLWSELRRLHPSVDPLRTVNASLARQLVEINERLEAATVCALPLSENGGMAEGASIYDEEKDDFGRIFKQQRTALGERDGLISRIRKLQGFENFEKPLTFHTLRAAASCGPVIIINHCKRHSDILILLHDSAPSIIPTADDFYDSATKLKNDLLETRKKYSSRSPQYDKVLRSTLEELYTIVGQPVVERLRELLVPEQSRLWWCPTSVFCHLPLHAMGPIPSNEWGKRYFSDIYVCSYTPTLTALLWSQKPSVPMSDIPSLLIVGPNEQFPGVRKEISTIEAHFRGSARRLVSEFATSSALKENLRRHSYLHLTCNAYLEAGKPLDSWFKLQGRDRLSLFDIMRSRFPNAEFAFLSASHSAALTDKSIDDEVLHLAAAMQFCGFRSVVGAMWAVVDDDRPELASHFYKSIFSGEETEVPPYRRSALALRNAVQKLRQKRGVTLERWVNFVHYGA
ncbi:CHAT domain containing protein [Lactarius tabidus]